jgi:hypothetical protein
MAGDTDSAGPDRVPGEASSGPDGAGRSSRAWSFVRFGLPALALVLVGICFFTNVFEQRFLLDDSFISFRYARHLVEGYGLVWNPGEPVEGYTNFLWVVLMAAGMWLGVEPELSSHVLGILSGCGLLLVLLGFALRRNSLWDPWPWLLLFLLALSESYTAWCSSGMETMLFALLAFCGASAYIREREKGAAAPLLSSALLAAATLTRPEGAIFMSAVGAFFAVDVLRRQRSIRSGLVWAAPYVAVVGLHLLWRHSYYGYWLPNTFYAKVPGLWWENGFSYLWLFLRTYQLGWFLPLIFLPLFGRDRYVARLYLSLLGIYCLYVAAVGGDPFEFRFLVPVLTLLYWLLVEGVRVLESFSFERQAARLAAKTLAWAAALALLATTHHGSLGGLEKRELRGTAPVESFAYYTRSRIFQGRFLARAIREGVLPSDLVVCLGGSGAVPYYTGWTIVDRRGLNDERIAHTPIARRGDVVYTPLGKHGRIAHERDAPYDYLVERKVVVFDLFNRLVHIPKRESSMPRFRLRESGPLRIRGVKIRGFYFIFASLVPDEELANIFPNLLLYDELQRVFPKLSTSDEARLQDR